MTKHWLMTRAAIAVLIFVSAIPVSPTDRQTATATLALPETGEEFETGGIFKDKYIVVLRDGGIQLASITSSRQFSTDVHVTHLFESSFHGFSAEMSVEKAEEL